MYLGQYKSRVQHEIELPQKVVGHLPRAWALQSSLGKFPWCQTTGQGFQDSGHFSPRPRKRVVGCAPGFSPLYRRTSRPCHLLALSYLNWLYVTSESLSFFIYKLRIMPTLLGKPVNLLHTVCGCVRVHVSVLGGCWGAQREEITGKTQGERATFSP